MSSVIFRAGTKAQYDALAVKDTQTFYFLNDVSDLYIGEVKLSNATDLAAAVADIAQNAADIAEIQSELETLEGNENVAGSIRNLIKAASDLLMAEINKKTTQVITSPSGKAYMFNESDGGGAKFENSDGTYSFAGVNDGGKNGITGQLYTIDSNDSNRGTRLNMTLNGFYYTTGKTSAAYTADDEIAVKGDVNVKQDKTLETPLQIGGTTVTSVEGALSALNNATGDGVASKSVYMVHASTAGSEYSSIINFYQGSEGSTADPEASELIGTINIKKDQFVDEASVVDITYDDGKLYDGSTDVTDLIKGAGVPAVAADAGKYAKLIFAVKSSESNAKDTIYFSLREFIDVYTGGSTPEITVSIDANNNITGTIGEVAASKIMYTNADTSEVSVQNKISSIEANLTWQTIE